MLWLLATLALARETVVRPADIDGVRVDGGAIARLDASGRIAGIYGRDLPAQGRGEPILPAADAIAAALTAARGSAPRARIAWEPTGDALRRVWTVEIRRPTGLVEVRLDAVTGLVLTVEDGAVPLEAPTARAYVNNPVVDAAPLDVVLPFAAEGLSDERVEILQCRDLGELETLETDAGTWDLHVCSQVPADPPVDGAYLYEPVPYPADGRLDEDDFVAPHMYWNIHAGLDWFDALGWIPGDDFLDPRLTVTVNTRATDVASEDVATDPDAPLAGYENAYSTGGYLDSDDEWVHPELVFGQGEIVDYGYDADVVHHELGHFIVRSQNGPRSSPPGPWGPSTRASAVNEGVADYFSSAIQGDPDLAEYAGYDAPIRELDGVATCAADLTGESHNDGLLLAQTLWQVRTGLPETDRPLLDAAVLDSLSVMGPAADFPDAIAAIGDLVGERLGPVGSVLLDAELDARGLRDCPPITDVAADGLPFRRYTQVPGAYSSTAGEVPGYLQFRVEIPPGGARLTLLFQQVEAIELDLYGDLVPQPLEIHGRTGDRITWRQEELTVGEGDAERTVRDWLSDARQVAVAEAYGTEPVEDAILHNYSATWDVWIPGSYVFQLANTYPRTAIAYGPTLLTSEPPPEDLVVRSGCDSTGQAWGSWILASLGVALRVRRRPRDRPVADRRPAR